MAADAVGRARMATEIPSAITIPDSVESRLGTLRFVDGFPDDATVEKVFDNLDFQRAVQVFLVTMPAAGCTCRPTSPQRASGRSCSTTTRHARCSRPTTHTPALEAKRRAS